MIEDELENGTDFFKCDKCPRMYQRNFSLESHMLKKHSQSEKEQHHYDM